MSRPSKRVMSAAAVVVLAAACPAVAIEMFTYFGDGSRIGLPSLEVPVQAYPGIPLRSDRIRARSRANQGRRAAAANDAGARAAANPVAVPPPIPGGGIRIRPMPTEPIPGTGGAWPTAPMPAMDPASVPPATSAVGPARRDTPEPVARPSEKILPGLNRPLFPPRQ